jgi:hypothetical protein
MNPPIPCELVANPKLFAEHILEPLIPVLVFERTLMEDRPVVRPLTTHHNTQVRYTSVPRAECKPLIPVLERGKAVQVIGLLHTQPPYCVLQL